MMPRTREIHFEDEVFESLTVDGGWDAGDSSDVDFTTALGPTVLHGFIESSQPDEWSRYLARKGGDLERARTELRRRIASEIDQWGSVRVLRNGFSDSGISFSLCFFKPANGLTPILAERYAANRLVVTRQQRYSPDHSNTLDLCLWVNGIPLATVELKNHLTHQSVEDAKAQYRKDRDPNDRFLSRRAVVHFAVDPALVFMTTRLSGDSTVFLPFNRGHDHHKGNPPAADGKHATAYLWERVWQRDSFLDLVGRFIHTQIGTDGSSTGLTIFPRFHQWDCVLGLEAHARENGPGQKYLAQHSAGSGKSNSIAWLAHRLSKLHNDQDQPVFDKVVVITDRRVLDDQLQATIFQFEHTAGVVERIESRAAGSKSERLAAALNSEAARIIICTLQTFSYVLDRIEDMARRNYAVIVDEAHSSQTGDAARDLRAALGAASEDARLEAAERADADDDQPSGEDLINVAVAARGYQPNLSFFAFTATPKPRTVELFGTVNEVGLKVPFHVYSMRQAIEEGFILDVLKNYTTFGVFWRVAHAGTDDREVDRTDAAAQIARQVSLHPHNLAMRSKIIVDHFRDRVAHRIGGHAKAMVVTSSRLHAVRYKQAIDSYLGDQGFQDVKALVAFSGKVIDDDPDNPFTEPGMNGFPESETAARFRGDNDFDIDGYQVMIVAEKFQTGFDAPMLHTMYVDKKLEDVAAVQTLARLNRTAPGKNETFVLDFRNEADDIADSFRPFYDTTIVEPVDPNVLYTYQGKLAMAGVYDSSQVDRYWTVFATVAPNDRRGNGALYSALAGPLTRFTEELDDDAQEEFRSDLDGFIRAYSFVSQIIDWTDTGLEKLYVFGKSLSAVLPPRDGDGRLDLGSEVELTHLRIDMAEVVDATLAADRATDAPVQALTGAAGAAHRDPIMERLSAIVDRINERHALNLALTDALLFEQFRSDWINDAELAEQARVNDFDNFLVVFTRRFLSTVLARMDTNAAIFRAINDDQAFQDELRAMYAREVYDAINRRTSPDREAYRRAPEEVDEFWTSIEAWGDE